MIFCFLTFVFIVCEINSNWTDESLSTIRVSILDRNDDDLNFAQIDLLRLSQFKIRFESIKVTCDDELSLFLSFEPDEEEQLFRLSHYDL